MLLGILAALVGTAAVAYAASSSTPATTTAPNACANLPALPAGYTWADVTSGIAPGSHLRISMTATDFATVTQSQAIQGTGITGWINLLGSPSVQTALGTSNICAWAPGQALPLDWPADDLDAGTEYHADFVYQGTATLSVSALPFPVSAWVATPPVSIKGPTPPTTGTGTTTLTTGTVIYPGQTPVTVNVPKSTNPQTAHLTPPGGNVAVTGTLAGTPITIVIDGGGTFTDVTETGATTPSALPTLAFFVYTTPDASGVITIQWQDTSGNPYSSTVTYS